MRRLLLIIVPIMLTHACTKEPETTVVEKIVYVNDTDTIYVNKTDTINIKTIDTVIKNVYIDKIKYDTIVQLDSVYYGLDNRPVPSTVATFLGDKKNILRWEINRLINEGNDRVFVFCGTAEFYTSSLKSSYYITILAAKQGNLRHCTIYDIEEPQNNTSLPYSFTSNNTTVVNQQFFSSQLLAVYSQLIP